MCLENPVVQLAQYLADIRPHIVIVLHDEDGVGNLLGDIVFSRLLLAEVSKQSRQIEFHCRPVANLTVDLDVSSRLFDKAVYLAQAEPSSLSDGLGCEKRFKNTAQDLS